MLLGTYWFSGAEFAYMTSTFSTAFHSHPRSRYSPVVVAVFRVRPFIYKTRNCPHRAWMLDTVLFWLSPHCRAILLISRTLLTTKRKRDSVEFPRSSCRLGGTFTTATFNWRKLVKRACLELFGRSMYSVYWRSWYCIKANRAWNRIRVKLNERIIYESFLTIFPHLHAYASTCVHSCPSNF